jgi:hypothetical protein
MHWIDPESLPTIAGTVERFIANPHGELDGLVLIARPRDEAELVHVPPHMGRAVAEAVRPGEAVRVHGVRPRRGKVVAAVSIVGADGRAIVDEGPDGDEPPAKPRKPGKHDALAECAGTVRLALYAPKGELRGALLEDGATLRIGPKEADRFAELLRPGAAVAARGRLVETAYGAVIDVREIGPALDRLGPAKRPKPHAGPGKHGPARRHDDKPAAAGESV